MKKFGITVAIILGVYLLLYLVLTLVGEYQATSANVVGVPDRYVWQPKLMRVETNKKLNGEEELESNVLGAVYMPLVFLDRAVWHQEKSLVKGAADKIKESMDSE